MATFTVRVELHNTAIDHPKYTDIHKIMYAHGFKRVFLDKDRDLILLPRAEYVGDGTGSALDVAAEAYGWIQHVHGETLVIATMWGSFGSHGNKQYAPIVHERSGTPGLGTCGEAPRVPTWVRPSKGEAEEFVAASGGKVCPNCFKRG